MIQCGNCGRGHATVEEVRDCSQGKEVAALSPSSPQPYKPDPNRIVTGNCRVLSCKNTRTGTVAELAGWACSPEHEAKPKTAQVVKIDFEVGKKALYNGKRFEVMEINNDDKTIRIRTGGAGKVVQISEVQPA